MADAIEETLKSGKSYEIVKEICLVNNLRFD